MNNNLAYLSSILIFAGIPLSLEFVCGYHLFKPFFKKLAKMIIIALILVPILEGVAFRLNAWQFNPERNLNIVILGDVLETYIFTIFIFCAIAFAVYAWSYYEDKGLPIIRTSLDDVIYGTYAIWRKEKPKKL